MNHMCDPVLLQRDFKYSGPAFASTLLPEARRARINPGEWCRCEKGQESVTKVGQRITVAR